MNKKTYYAPAVTVAEGSLQPMLISASQIKKITSKQDYAFQFEVESQENSLKLDNPWKEEDNAESDEWNF